MASLCGRVRARWMGGAAAIALLGCMAMPVGARAQTAGTSGEAPADQDGPDRSTASAGDRDGASTQDVVVTGSRVITNGNNSPTPLTVATTEALLEVQPAGVIEGLNNLPGLLGSINPTSSVNSGGYNTLNLRGIGSNRALILFDGRRVGPTQPGAQVDVDVVPQFLLQRVDVVTGGASAVYGSDAVSGVVNFVTDRKFDGLKAELSNGISRYGDDRKTQAAIAFGRSFAGGRGHVEASYEFKDAPGFLRSDRPYFQPNYTIQGAVPGGGTSGTAANPYTLVRDARLSTASFGGLILTGPLAGLQFAQNGQLSTFNTGTRTGTTGTQIGGDGATYVRAQLGTAQRLHRSFARADYDLTDTVHAYAEGIYTHFDQEYSQQNLFINNLLIGYNNPYLQAVQPAYRTIINAQPAGSSFRFGKVDTAFPNYRIEAKEDYYLGSAGLEGKLGSYDWDVNYYHTDSAQRQTNPYNISNPRLYASLNAVTNPATGATVCNAALVNPSVYGNCVPLNVFGPTADNQAAIDYIGQRTSAVYHFITNDVNATISGSPFSLPAGAVNVALNGEWRRQTYKVDSDATPFDAVSCTGIQFNCVAGTTTPYLVNQVTIRTPVRQTVYEGAIEANVPLLADLPLIASLDLNGAARYTHYATSGGVWTWKAGGVWKPVEWLTLRGTRSRDIRAATLNELFAAPTYTLRNYTDLHTNTAGTLNSISQGNPDLVPERADTLTLGGVLRPALLPGFSFSVDYYRIRISDAIVGIDSFAPATQLACEASNGAADFCALYDRPLPFSDRTAANYPRVLYNQNLNVAALKTYGIDFELNYAGTLAGRGLKLRALVNYQPQLLYDNGPSGIVDVGGAADGIGGLPPIPKVKVVGSVGYDLTDSVRLLVQERWRSALRQNGSRALIFAIGDVKSVGYTDVNLNFRVNGRFSLFFNTQNLFDTKPPEFASSGGSAQPNYLGGYAQGDDIEGRFMTAGVRLRM